MENYVEMCMFLCFNVYQFYWHPFRPSLPVPRPFTIMMKWVVKVGTKLKIYIETCMFSCFHV